MDAIDRLPKTGDAGVVLKQRLAAKLIEHTQYINTFGQDMPEIRDWTWSATPAGTRGSSARKDTKPGEEHPPKPG